MCNKLLKYIVIRNESYRVQKSSKLVSQARLLWRTPEEISALHVSPFNPLNLISKIGAKNQESKKIEDVLGVAFVDGENDF